jgi:hypothetical protein
VSVLNLGVTGHRHLARAQDVLADVERALRSVEERYPGRPLRLFSSLAEGADRIVATQVLSREASSLVAVLPMPRQDYVADFLSPESRDEFSRLVEAADAIVELRRAHCRVGRAAASRYRRYGGYRCGRGCSGCPRASGTDGPGGPLIA